MTRVLVVEDEAGARDVLVGLLDHLGYDAFAALSGVEGLREVSRVRPDIVILDLGLPDMSGMEVIRELRTWSEVPILVVSGSTHRQRKADALDAGADDFLDKPFDVAELRARVRVAERRLAHSRDDVTTARHFGELAVDVDRRTVVRGGEEVRLTDTEWVLAQALSSRPGQVLTQRWLVRHVWGPRAGAESAASLRSHLRSLRAKIGDDAREPRYIRTESGVGYRWIHLPTADGPADPVAVADRLRAELEDALQRRGATDPAVRELTSDLVDLVQRVVRGADDVEGEVAGDAAERAGDDTSGDPVEPVGPHQGLEPEEGAGR